MGARVDLKKGRLGVESCKSSTHRVRCVRVGGGGMLHSCGKTKNCWTHALRVLPFRVLFLLSPLFDKSRFVIILIRLLMESRREILSLSLLFVLIINPK